MQKIWMLMSNERFFVYVIAGVCIWGILSKLLVQGRLFRLLKASEQIKTTKNRQLQTIRHHYENSLNMDLQVHNIHAFVDKYLLKLKCCGIPIRIFDSMTMEAALLSVAVGGLGIIHIIHRNSSEEMIFQILFAAIASCACLLSLENIFRIENSIERLQANLEDYLENDLRNRLGRPLVSRQNRGQTQAAASGETSGHPEGRVDRTQTVGEGRAFVRPQIRNELSADREQTDLQVFSREQDIQGAEEVPEYEVRSGATAGQEAAASQEAELVAQVLRNFFSS